MAFPKCVFLFPFGSPVLSFLKFPGLLFLPWIIYFHVVQDQVCIYKSLNVNFAGQIGQGTYSNVYKARDLDNGKIVALKKVRFDNLEPESVRFMAREIQVLRRLDHPNVVKLEGMVTSRMSCSLYLAV